MRLIGKLENEHTAQRFCAFLKREKIDATCEMAFDPPTGHMSYPIWIHNEDQISKAATLFEEFQKNPADKKFDAPLIEQIQAAEELIESEPAAVIPERKKLARITTFFLALCFLIFFLNATQELSLAEKGVPKGSFFMTPIQEQLLFDIPPPILALQDAIIKFNLKPGQAIDELPADAKAAVESIGNTPYFRGLYEIVLLKAKGQDAQLAKGPLFGQILQGQAWRLFSPCVLHTDFLHILFNMIWLWVLGRPIEQRIGGWRTLLLTVIVGVLANVAQYLMSGPFFLGYSGIVMGLAGFIWVREKKAPWEGYPLHRSTILFLVFFILAMFALQTGSFILTLFTTVEFTPNIANTAHIAGGLIGAWLGRLSYFAARPNP